MDSAIQHKENDSRGVFLMEGDAGKISELTYIVKDEHTIIIDHTETKMGYEGQGYASKLMAAAVDYARSKTIKIIPLCPFAEVQFDEHSEYSDVRAN